MPAENPIVGYGQDVGYELNQVGIPYVDVRHSGLPAAIATSAMYGSPGTSTSTNAAGTSENVAMHLAVLVALALIGIFVFRQAGIRFAFAVGGR